MGSISPIFMLCFFLPILLAANFTTYWNVFSHHCKKEIEPILKEYGIETNANLNFSGEKVALFYEFFFGRYPYYKDYNRTLPINGGTPQNLTKDQLDLHLNISEYNITKILPENASGLAIIDFEEWRPLFRQNVNKKKVYQNASFEIVEAKYNSTGKDLNKAAKEEYNEAAKKFILQTIDRAKELRPNASWGLYGFPYCNYDAGKKGKGEYNCSKDYQQYNDEYELFSLNFSFEGKICQRVAAILREANRIAQKYKPPLPIFPYTKFEYDPLNHNCSFYSDEDLCSTIKLPALMGVNGLIFWSSSRNMQTRCNATKDFVNLKIGPIVQNATREWYTPGPFNITTILNFNETCSSFTVPINDTMYGGICNSTCTTFYF